VKLYNRIIAFILTAVLMVGSSTGFLTVHAAESITVGMEDGLKASGLVFSGTPREVSEIGLFRDRMGISSTLEISMTFKIASAATDYINLLEIFDKSNNTSAASTAQSAIAVIVSKGGTVYFEAGSNKTGTDWQTSTGVSNIADGKSHTLQMTVSADSLTCQMDDAGEKAVTIDGAKDTKKFMSAFFGGTAAGYQDWRKNINTIVLGGLSSDSYFKNSAYSDLNGEISDLTITGGQAPASQTGGAFAEGMFSAAADNTWMFGGGIETQGRFAEIAGERNYIGQFEEYIRWTNSGGSSDAPLPMQRYTINVGKKGQDAVQFAENLDTYISKIDPKAVSYLIGPEDYRKGEEGIEEFKTAIAAIIQKSLHMKEDGGYIALQLPHAVTDAALAAEAARYADAAKEVYNEAAVEEEDGKRMALVDHLTLTDTKDFKDKKLTEDLLNADGHYEIAKQLAQTVKGSVGDFLTISKGWILEETPDFYLEETPEAVADQNHLTVTVPEDIAGTQWQYNLKVQGTEIKGTAYQNPFIIENLPADESYELVVLCKNEDTITQLSPVEGTMKDQDQAKRPEAAGELQKAIREKAEKKDTPLTWLFMGDSITHGAMHLKGYDSIAQLFEKYLKEDLGRTDDIVVNTAVSGATTATSGGRGTLTHMEERMAKYKPDIVSVMLGTNDTIDDAYGANLKQIADEIRDVNEDAIIIFRTPSPAGRNYASKLPGETGSVARMKKVADENGILFIDQYTDWNNELSAYTYLFDADHYFGDGYLHPGPAGHARMTTQFIRECGLNTNTKIANFSYRFGYTDETSAVTPAIETAEDKSGVIISKTALQTAYGNGTIGDLTVVLTDAEGRTYTRELGLDEDEAVIWLPQNRRYTVNVTAKLTGSAAKRVIFAEQEILLGEETQDPADLKEAEAVAEKINAIGEITGNIDSDMKQKIKEARAAYEKLTDSQKLLVSNEMMELLTAAEEILDRQEAAEVGTRISVLGNVSKEEITEEKAEEIRAVSAAYQALTDKQKSFIPFTVREQLNAAEEALDQKEAEDKQAADQKAADAVTAKIQAIGTVANTSECKQKIDEARAAYNALTNDQKQLISAGITKLLTDAETQYQVLSKKPEIEIGNIYAVDNYLYRITSDSTAEAVGIKADTEKTIQIPDTVSFGDRNYRITSIQASAFSKKKATSAIIGKNVEIIGKNAFAGCRKLKKVTVKSTALKEIQSKAFSSCKVLKNITIKSKVLKKAGKNCFKGIHKKAVIKVPSGKYKDYAKLLAKRGQSGTVKIKK